MPIRKDSDAFPVGTVVRLKSGQFAIIKQVCYLKEEKTFLHYLREVEVKRGLYALYHDDIFLCLPAGCYLFLQCFDPASFGMGQIKNYSQYNNNDPANK